jgi:hypothetical protein
VDDTFAIHGGKEAKQWQARHAKSSSPANRLHRGGRRKLLVQPKQVTVRLSASTFQRLDAYATKLGVSLNKQIAQLCEEFTETSE